MTLVKPKRKWLMRVSIRQFGAGPNHEGNGPRPARYRKKHLRAQQQAGQPQGACIFNTTRKDRQTCRCGGHNLVRA